MKKLKLFIFLISCLQMMGQSPQIKWWYDTDDMAFGNAAMADVDEDGLPEIVFSTYRNDERIIVLNAEDGSLLWDYNTGGCNDVAPLIADVDLDGNLEIILPGSCVPKTWCFDAATGNIEWICTTHGSDSPPVMADVDNDDKPEIIHGGFDGWITCINGEYGSIQWEFNADPNSWIQTAPAILDVDNNGQLDFIVANWSFGTNHRIFAFRGDDHSLIWESDLPQDVTYHGAAIADIDEDGNPELAIGSYDGVLRVLNAEDGSLLWDYAFNTPTYIGAPVSIGNLNQDENLELVFIDWYKLGVVSKNGNLIWNYNIPGYANSFRGAALSDVNEDGVTDVVIGTSEGDVIALSGNNGNLIWNISLRAHYGGDEFEIDHGPLISDFDNDGLLDIFVVGGHAEYPAVQNNFGRAYAITLESSIVDEGWTMFRHDLLRNACACNVPVFPGVSSQKVNSGNLVKPNPNDGSFMINIQPGVAFSLEVLDVTGKCVYQSKNMHNNQKQVMVKLANPHRGFYFLHLTMPETTRVQKFLVQ